MIAANGTAGTAWAARSAELTRWAAARLVVRRDVWGAYGGSGQLTLPAKKDRGAVTLADAKIEQHFRATQRRDILGLHTTSPQNVCLAGSLDIDRHGDGGPSPEQTETAALHWYEKQRRIGFCPLLNTSNGSGGFHERILFRTPAPAAEVYAYLGWLTADYEQAGLPTRPECFPKQKAVTKRNPCGNWLRLPGRHHSREHWSRVWDGSRWLDGAAAVDFILSIGGDDPDLMLTPRIEAYISKMPNLSEGNGRDDRGYNLAAFLVRDLGLDDAKARPWLTRWDSQNAPPKREEDKWLANAHQYGQRPYGSGRKSETKADARPEPEREPTDEPKPACVPGTAANIIREHWRQRYGLKFRRGTALYSADLDRDMRPGELLIGASSDLIELLGEASDAPREDGKVPRHQRPLLFKKWAPTAYADLLAELPEETKSEEVIAAASETFRAAVVRGLLVPVTLRRTKKVRKVIDRKVVEVEEQIVERRPVVDWTRIFAAPNKWGDVRGHRIWGQLTGAPPRLRIALRVELFGGQVACAELARMTPRRFADLCEAYEIGQRCKVAGGVERAVELNPAFLDDLLACPELGPPPWEQPPPQGQNGQNGQTDSASRTRTTDTVCPSVASVASVRDTREGECEQVADDPLAGTAEGRQGRG